MSSSPRKKINFSLHCPLGNWDLQKTQVCGIPFWQSFLVHMILCFVAVCKSCVVKYLQSSKCCPQCGLKIHETQPLLNLKSDRVMQDVVFKLVPGLYESEFIFLPLNK